jgi:hypothetical protein
MTAAIKLECGGGGIVHCLYVLRLTLTRKGSPRFLISVNRLLFQCNLYGGNSLPRLQSRPSLRTGQGTAPSAVCSFFPLRLMAGAVGEAADAYLTYHHSRQLCSLSWTGIKAVCLP